LILVLAKNSEVQNLNAIRTMLGKVMYYYTGMYFKKQGEVYVLLGLVKAVVVQSGNSYYFKNLGFIFIFSFIVFLLHFKKKTCANRHVTYFLCKYRELISLNNQDVFLNYLKFWALVVKLQYDGSNTLLCLKKA
jgi:hypothetical protein